MAKLFFIFFVFGLLLFSLAGSSLADVSCQPIYGGGQTCISTGNIAVTKTVQNPKTFNPGDQVTFIIQLTNTGSATIPQVAVTDIFPGNSLTFVSSTTNGVFNSNTNTLSFATDNLAPGEKRDFTVVAKIPDASSLQGQSFCVLNQVTAVASTGGQMSNNAQVCIQKPQATTKGGLPVFPPSQVTTTPPTGPEMLPLISLLPGGLAGFLLRRKSSKIRGGDK